MKELVKLFGIGMILGVSNVIPGVSGGTMAVVFGIYDRLISVITINVKKIVSMWKFWLPLGSGVIVGILAFSKLVTLLFEQYSMPTNWFFIGLILGSVPLIFAKTKQALNQNEVSQKKTVVHFSTAICALITLSAMICMTVFRDSTFSQTAYTTLTVSLFIRLLISAALAAIAMIIPGISGSFLLLALGAYTTIIGAISDMNIALLLPVALGVPIGLFGGAGLVRVLLNKLPSQTYGAILGLVLGSVVVIYPGLTFSSIGLISLATCASGFFLAFLSSKTE